MLLRSDQMKINLSDHKRMRYLDYKLNNNPKLSQKFPRKEYPRLIDYLVQTHHLDQGKTTAQIKVIKQDLYQRLWKQGLFHSCQM